MLYLTAMASFINQKVVVSLDVDRVNDGVCETLGGYPVDCCTLAPGFPGEQALMILLGFGFVWAGFTWNNVKMATVAGRGLWRLLGCYLGNNALLTSIGRK